MDRTCVEDLSLAKLYVEAILVLLSVFHFMLCMSLYLLVSLSIQPVKRRKRGCTLNHVYFLSRTEENNNWRDALRQ